MGCFVVAEFLLTSASRSPSAIAEPLVHDVVALFNLAHTRRYPIPFLNDRAISARGDR